MTLFHFTGSAFRDDKNPKVQAPLLATEGVVSASCAGLQVTVKSVFAVIST